MRIADVTKPGTFTAPRPRSGVSWVRASHEVSLCDRFQPLAIPRYLVTLAYRCVDGITRILGVAVAVLLWPLYLPMMLVVGIQRLATIVLRPTNKPVNRLAARGWPEVPDCTFYTKTTGVWPPPISLAWTYRSREGPLPFCQADMWNRCRPSGLEGLCGLLSGGPFLESLDDCANCSTPGHPHARAVRQLP